MELGQLVVQVQLFVVGEEVAAHFELVGFAAVVGCPSQIRMISPTWIIFVGGQIMVLLVLLGWPTVENVSS